MDDEMEEDDSCPLCMNSFDPTDQAFLACPCNYQVCLFCVHYMIEQMDGKCPACRQDYQESSFRYDAERATRYREREDKKKARDSRGPRADEMQQNRGDKDLKKLMEQRVLQRKVVHVVGLTPKIAKAEVLQRPEYFGKYGIVHRVTIRKDPTKAKMSINSGNRNPAIFGAYLTFDCVEEARAAIFAVDGISFDGHVVRASFGTTKYCRKFLEGETCDRSDCMFLHDTVDENGMEKGAGKGVAKGKSKDECTVQMACEPSSVALTSVTDVPKAKAVQAGVSLPGGTSALDAYVPSATVEAAKAGCSPSPGAVDVVARSSRPKAKPKAPKAACSPPVGADSITNISSSAKSVQAVCHQPPGTVAAAADVLLAKATNAPKALPSGFVADVADVLKTQTACLSLPGDIPVTTDTSKPETVQTEACPPASVARVPRAKAKPKAAKTAGTPPFGADAVANCSNAKAVKAGCSLATPATADVSTADEFPATTSLPGVSVAEVAEEQSTEAVQGTRSHGTDAPRQAACSSPASSVVISTEVSRAKAKPLVSKPACPAPQGVVPIVGAVTRAESMHLKRSWPAGAAASVAYVPKAKAKPKWRPKAATGACSPPPEEDNAMADFSVTAVTDGPTAKAVQAAMSLASVSVVDHADEPKPESVQVGVSPPTDSVAFVANVPNATANLSVTPATCSPSPESDTFGENVLSAKAVQAAWLSPPGDVTAVADMPTTRAMPAAISLSSGSVDALADEPKPESLQVAFLPPQGDVVIVADAPNSKVAAASCLPSLGADTVNTKVMDATALQAAFCPAVTVIADVSETKAVPATWSLPSSSEADDEDFMHAEFMSLPCDDIISADTPKSNVSSNAASATSSSPSGSDAGVVKVPGAEVVQAQRSSADEAPTEVSDVPIVKSVQAVLSLPTTTVSDVKDAPNPEGVYAACSSSAVANVLVVDDPKANAKPWAENVVCSPSPGVDPVVMDASEPETVPATCPPPARGVASVARVLKAKAKPKWRPKAVTSAGSLPLGEDIAVASVSNAETSQASCSPVVTATATAKAVQPTQSAGVVPAIEKVSKSEAAQTACSSPPGAFAVVAPLAQAKTKALAGETVCSPLVGAHTVIANASIANAVQAAWCPAMAAVADASTAKAKPATVSTSSGSVSAYPVKAAADLGVAKAQSVQAACSMHPCSRAVVSDVLEANVQPKPKGKVEQVVCLPGPSAVVAVSNVPKAVGPPNVKVRAKPKAAKSAPSKPVRYVVPAVKAPNLGTSETDRHILAASELLEAEGRVKQQPQLSGVQQWRPSLRNQNRNAGASSISKDDRDDGCQ
eukprot:TRINITY_DN6877_c0_g1_i2.p1 TRINITY_DN6877_c0_g1~~TRINITY_DN6877_c0_g1_i2.p1  ORF type:complete len:1316 (-),score=282.38 TRINITY_DN6877_c0_g1_i2:152-4099(-)